MSFYDELPPDLTEAADDDERHWRGLAELMLPGESEGPEL